MYTEDLTFHDCPDAQIIEYFHLVFPSVRVAVLPHALIIKAIDAADLSGFMVAPEQGNVAWIPNLQTHQQLKSLHWIVASIDVVTHEYVVGCGDHSTLLKKLEQIVELAMDIATDSDWCGDWLYIGLLDQQLFYLVAKLL